MKNLTQGNPSTLELALMNLPTGLFISDAAGIIIFINKAYANYLRVRPEEALGRHLSEFFPDSGILRVIASGEPELGALRHIPNSESKILVNRYPLRDAQDRLVGAMAMALLDRPEQMAALQQQVESLSRKVSTYARRMKAALEARHTVDSILGTSEAIRDLKNLLLRFARTGEPVLICGATGTGKELAANAIHNASDRTGGPFVSINCAAIPRELFESELFGYEAGAFSGAGKDGRVGQIELADKGTLFLDEVGDLPLEAQVKLLRVLEEKIVRRIGSNKLRHVDFRLVTATNRDLAKMIAAGTFREDFYYRINPMTLHMPPLVGRKEDIALLVRHMLARYEGVGCTEAAMRALMAYSWPGNIRELNNAVSHALSLRRHSQIDIGDLPPGIVRNATEQPVPATPGKLQSMRRHGEQRALAVALNEYGWNVARAARSLGISRSTMYAKIRALGLRRPR